MKKAIVFLITSVFTLCFIVQNGRLFAENLDPSQLVDLIKNTTHEIKALQWTCNTKHYRIVEGEKTELPSDETVDVYYDLTNHFYHIKRTGETLSLDDQGAEHLGQYSSEISYDGKVYREWRIDGIDNNDTTQNAQGVVSEDLNDCINNHEFLENRFALIGMISGVPGVVYAGPNLTANCLFADYISEKHKENKILSCETTENNLIKISVQDHLTLPGVSSPITVEILYNPLTSIIENLESHYNNTSPVIKYSEISGDYTEHSEKTFPEHIVFKQMQKNVTMQSEYDFKDFVINPVVNLQDTESFFPDGTYVNNIVANKYYKVGSPVDEDREIGEFMQRRGLTGDTHYILKRNNVVRYALIGIGIVMIFFALWQMIQKRKKTQ